MEDVKILEFDSFDEGMEEDVNLLMDSKTLESYLKANEEDFTSKFLEPDIADLAGELANLEAAYAENIHQLKTSSAHKDEEEHWEGISLHLTDLTTQCDTKKLELLETVNVVKVIDNEISSLRGEISQLKRRERELKSQLSSKESTLSQMSRDIDEFQSLYGAFKSQKSKSKELQREIEKYEAVLGLSLEMEDDGNILLKFSQLDPASPEREFTCHLSLDSSSKNPIHYKVLNVTPPIQGIDRLETLLNKTQELNGFVVTLRRKFKEEVTKNGL